VPIDVLGPGTGLVAPTLTDVHDPLRTTPMLRDPAFAAEVAAWTERLDGSTAPWVAADLERMGTYASAVDSMLAERGLPPSLRYLPVIESGYDPDAVSPASAVGLWQLMAGTARELGIRVSPLVDERRDPFVSTAAALTFLEDLHGDFGSWFLALAAYNSGPARVRGLMRRHAPLATPSDSLYWALRPHLPRETRDFVPKLLATMMIGERPSLFGHPPVRVEPIEYEEVDIPDATTLDVIAGAAGVAEEEIARLNPQLLRAMTPPGVSVVVRVPKGTAGTFRTRYALIPPEERVSFVEHRVASGETLSHIAVRYGIRVSDLEAANPTVRPRYLRVGAVLTVPVAPSARRPSG